MQRMMKWSALLPACLALVLAAGAAAAQDEKPAGRAKPRSPLDDQIHANLREVINHGANLYNTGDWNGCYRLWEGSLMTIKPMLPHRPKLQEAISKGLDTARQDPLLYRRAWVLRSVLDQVRADIKGEKEDGKGKEATTELKPKTLWARLGGEKGVTKVVDDFVNAAVADPKVDFFRRGKAQVEPAQVAKMKREIVEQVSQATGGPLKYNGPDMKKVHKGMGITNAQFDAATGHLKAALVKNKVAQEDVQTILGAINTYREEIVEPKKPEDKKPEDKKPTEKKPEGKKPAGTASIQGNVRLKGAPLKGGTIVLTNKEGKAEGKIAADGGYKVEGIKPGVYKVSIKGAKGAAVPAAFADPNTSALTFTVLEGKQTRDIDINLK